MECRKVHRLSSTGKGPKVHNTQSVGSYIVSIIVSIEPVRIHTESGMYIKFTLLYGRNN